MKLRFFDFEVFPDWWLCVAGDMPDDKSLIHDEIKDTFIYVDSSMPDARDKLMNMLKCGKVIVGYNIKSYDLVIANAIYQGFSPQQVKKVNDMIINSAEQYKSGEHMRLFSFTKRKLSGVVYQDLMDDNHGTLKEKEAILGLDIMESKVNFNKTDLTDEEKREIIYYCKHDVYAAMYYYSVVMEGYVKNKLTIGKKFGIPETECYMCTNAKLVAKALGAKRSSYGDLGKVEIFLPEKIRNYCYENLPSKIVDYVRTSTEGLRVNLFGSKVDFGNGGLHSILENNIYVEEDSEWMLMNADAASYYPSMLIQFQCLSRSVQDPSVFSNIYDERMYLKHKPDKTQDEEDSQLANKLVLNTVFGASGNKYLDLYDPYMCSRCCRLGQIFLAAFANKLYNNIPGLKVIQTNTDGILIYFRRKDLAKVREYMTEMSTISGINMEEDVVEKIWQRDVNNYLLIKEGGKIKRKGLWLMETWTKPGYFLISPLTAYVSQKAAIDWLVYGKDVIQSIVHNNNLLDFAITCKKGPSFRGVIQRFADGNEAELFKCNRIYASKNKSLGKIYKIKMYKGKLSYYQMPNIPEYCRTINNSLETYDFDKIKSDLDYMYYVEKAIELLEVGWKELIGDELVNTKRFDYDI